MSLSTFARDHLLCIMLMTPTPHFYFHFFPFPLSSYRGDNQKGKLLLACSGIPVGVAGPHPRPCAGWELWAHSSCGPAACECEEVCGFNSWLFRLSGFLKPGCWMLKWPRRQRQPVSPGQTLCWRHPNPGKKGDLVPAQHTALRKYIFFQIWQQSSYSSQRRLWTQQGRFPRTEVSLNDLWLMVKVLWHVVPYSRNPGTASLFLFSFFFSPEKKQSRKREIKFHPKDNAGHISFGYKIALRWTLLMQYFFMAFLCIIIVTGFIPLWFSFSALLCHFFMMLQVQSPVLSF